MALYLATTELFSSIGKLIEIEFELCHTLLTNTFNILVELCNIEAPQPDDIKLDDNKIVMIWNDKIHAIMSHDNTINIFYESEGMCQDIVFPSGDIINIANEIMNILG